MKNIKIVVCGLKGCGKTTLLRKLEQKGSVKFIEGSKALCEIAQVAHTSELKKLSQENINQAREEFLVRLENMHSSIPIAVDGHYSFLENGALEIVMSDRDFRIYDIVLFLDTELKRIQERLKQRDGVCIPLKDLQKWYDFELSGLQSKAKEHQKLFSVIDDTCEDVMQFIDCIIYQQKFLLPPLIFDTFLLDNKHILERHKKIILTDCDGTLDEKDGVKEFYKIKEVAPYKIPNAFHNHRFYGFYQFFRLNQKRLEIKECVFQNACKHSADTLKIHDNLIQAFRNSNATIVAITAGIGAIWKHVFDRFNLFAVLVSQDRHLIITQETKGYFAKKFAEMGYEVIAIGDGKVDIAMLENAHKPILMESKKTQEVYSMLSHSTKEKITIINPKTAIKTLKEIF